MKKFSVILSLLLLSTIAVYAVDDKVRINPNLKKYVKQCYEGADFSGKDLQGRNFDNSDMEEVNFEGANLQGASFKNADLEEANFKNANLKNVNFENADLEEANLQGANIEGANFKNAILEYAIWINGKVCAADSVGSCR